MEDKLNSKAYQTVSQRMQTEEATCALTMNNHPDDGEYVESNIANTPTRQAYDTLSLIRLFIIFSFYAAHSMAMTAKLAVPVQHLLLPLVPQEKVVNHNHCWNH